jgi:hypothetical protein
MRSDLAPTDVKDVMVGQAEYLDRPLLTVAYRLVNDVCPNNTMVSVTADKNTIAVAPSYT